jgi:hypothetical protein
MAGVGPARPVFTLRDVLLGCVGSATLSHVPRLTGSGWLSKPIFGGKVRLTKLELDSTMG